MTHQNTSLTGIACAGPYIWFYTLQVFEIFFFFLLIRGPTILFCTGGSHKLHSLSCLENWPCWLLGFMHKQSEAGRPSAEPASPCGACSRIGGFGAWLSSAHSLFSLHSPLISLSLSFTLLSNSPCLCLAAKLRTIGPSSSISLSFPCSHGGSTLHLRVCSDEHGYRL